MKAIFIALGTIISFATLAQKPELIIPTGHERAVMNVLYSNDGKYIFSASENYVKVWERSSGRLLKNIVCKWGDREPAVVDMDASPDGKTIAIATYRNIHFFSLEAFVVSKEIHLDEISKILYSRNGTEMFVAHGEEKEEHISKINIGNDNISGLYQHTITKDEYGISQISLSKDGSQLLVCMDKDGTAILNSETGKEIKMIAAENKVIAFTPAGTLLAVGKGTRTEDVLFQFLNATTLQPVLSASINYKDGDGVYDFLSDDCSFKQQLAWNPDNGNLQVASQHHLYSIDAVTGKVIKLKFEPDGYGKSIAVSKDGKQVTLGTSAPAVNEYSLAAQRYSRQYGSSIFITESIQAGTDSSLQLLLNSERGNISDLRFEKSNFSTKGLRTDNSFSVSALSKDGRSGAYFFQHTLHFFDPETMHELNETINLDENLDLHELAFSDNGKWLAAVSETKVVVFDVANKKVITKISTGVYELGAYHNYKIESISNDGKKLVTYTIKENTNGNGSILCFDIASGNVLWEKAMRACCFKFINNDKQVMMVVKDNPSLLIVDAATGNDISEKKLPFTSVYAANISNDSKRLACSIADFNTNVANPDILIWDLEKNESKAVLKGHTYVPGELSFLANPNFIVSASADNTTRIWDIRSEKELGTLITFEGSNDWVFITPDGRFDASPGALQTMYYVKVKDVLPLEALYEQYYTPRLISRLIAGERFDPVPDLADIKLRPTIKLTYTAARRNLSVEDDIPTYQNTTGAAEITVEATTQDDKVDEIRLFQNGKIVTLATRNLIVADDNQPGSTTKKFSVSLLEGVNTFRAVALNSQRTESIPAEMAIVYSEGNTSTDDTKPPINNTDGAPVMAVNKDATLYLVVVGINQYQNKNLNLNYALADATSFKAEVEKDAASIINHVQTYLVTDNAADTKGIEAAFAAVKKNAKPEDVFVFYYAGHGVIGDNKEFYLVPANVSDLKNVQAELEQKGIAARLLQQYTVDIAAQKQLFILDACQSAGAFETMLAADANQQKSIAVVARSTGTHWIAASGAQQFANEFSSLGHGVFTYVLLEALQGAASGSKMITVNNLKNYLQQAVPALMKKYHGTPQYPASYGFGNDFPVEILQ